MKKTCFLFVKKSILAICISSVLFSFVSCKKEKNVAAVSKENLFSLNYGKFEDELNLFSIGEVGEIGTSVAMRDGFFYIANAEAKKIMQFNSYGDLLTLYYNEQTNPVPTFASRDSMNSTRKAIAYPFNQIGCIAVDNDKNLFVADKLPDERCEYDKENHVSLNNVILRFSSDGKMIDYLGQEGPGGTPFPRIQQIYIVDNDEFVVLCSVFNGFIAYWFSKDGYLMYKMPIKDEYIPNPYESQKEESFYSIGNIVPDYKLRKLYIKIDYYMSYVDESSKRLSGTDYISSMVYPIKIETGEYENPFEIPSYDEQYTQGFSTVTYKNPYDFIGVTENGWFFFMISGDDEMNIQIFQQDGQKILKRRLPLDRDNCLYYNMCLDKSGIISILVAEKEKAHVDWWRTDNLIAYIIKK